jgi:GNAT superfamily N-acetyltransferase
MSMDYQIVPWREELLPQVVQLQTHLWGGDVERNAAYLKWKYIDNPFIHDTLIHLAESNGEIIGMGAFFGALWEIDSPSSRRLLPCADDFVVAPEHRNRGIASRIMSAAIIDAGHRGFPFAVSLGALDPRGSLAAGWRTAGTYEAVHRVVPEPRRAPIKTVIGPRPYARAGASLRNVVERGPFDELDRAGRQMSSPISVGRAPRPEPMANLVARLPWDGRLRHTREAAYLAWRFQDPSSEFRFLYWDHGGLQGYMVLQHDVMESPEVPPVHILDWEAADDHVRGDLLNAALRSGRFPRIEAWNVGAGESVRRLLREAGFEPRTAEGRRRSDSLLVRRLSAAASGWRLGGRDLLDIADWELRRLCAIGP